jgi:predicted GNAT family N-acyltransferase
VNDAGGPPLTLPGGDLAQFQVEVATEPGSGGPQEDPAVVAAAMPVVRLGSWEQFGAQARAVRLAVFVDEQSVPAELEIDRFDPVCVHALVLHADGGVLGTGRLLPDGHIGRIAVRREARSQGIGAAIVRELMTAASRRGDPQVELSSQLHAEGFYRRLGFERVGQPYEDVGIPHVTMRALLRSARRTIHP